MRNHRTWSRRSTPILALILLAVAMPGQAATYLVTRTDDPAPGPCLPGDCSLREAILAANAHAPADRVELPAGLHQLALGEIAVTGVLELAGAGDDASTVRGDGIAAMLRLANGASLEIRDLALDGPDPLELDGQPLRGNLPDAIVAEAGSTLLLEGTRVSLGAGRVATVAGTAGIELRDSSVVFMRCGHDSGLCRLHASEVQLLSVAGGDVEVIGSIVTGTLVPQIGSGMSIETSGTVLFEDSAIGDTFDGLSFQAQIPARVDLRRFRYLRNGSPLLARNNLVMWIEDAEFTDNRNRWTGDGGGPGAIHAYIGAIFHVTRTSFIGNLGTGDAGGAILVEGNASLWLTDSTFSGNGFTVEAAQGGVRGGAVAVRAGNSLTLAELRHATVVAPAVLPVGVTGSAFAVIGDDARVHMAVHNSIVRGSCNLGVVPGQMDFAQGNIKSGGDDCGFDPAQNQTGVSNAAMALGALGDHGAFARTYLPDVASVAIDTAATARCTDLDQRGYRRPFPGALCDVGAIEVGADDRIFADDFEG